LQLDPDAVQVAVVPASSPPSTVPRLVARSAHVTVVEPDERQLIGTSIDSEADSVTETEYVISELNVAVPLALRLPTCAVALGHELMGDPDDAGVPPVQVSTTFQVPTMSPPQGATLPQLSAPAPLPELLLHPRNVTPIAIQVVQAFMPDPPTRSIAHFRVEWYGRSGRATGGREWYGRSGRAAEMRSRA